MPTEVSPAIAALLEADRDRLIAQTVRLSVLSRQSNAQAERSSIAVLVDRPAPLTVHQESR